MFPHDYFASSYFAPTYWPGGSSPTPTPTPTPTGAGYFASSYFAATYFASAYWPHGSTSPTPTPTPTDGGYFASSYFASSYFAPTYWPSGSSPTPAPIAGSITGAFTAFRELLVTNGIFQENTCIVTLLDDIPSAPGAPYALIRPTEFEIDRPTAIGAGRFCSIIVGSFEIDIIVRNIEDIAYLNADVLENTDSTTGILSLSNDVMNILHLCFPLNSNGDMLCTEPPWCQTISQITPQPDSREFWRQRLTFTVSIQLTLTFP